MRSLYPFQYEDLLRRALDEDLGRGGDLTTDSLVPAEVRARGRVVARQGGRVAGLEVALHTFRLLDPSVECRVLTPDGSDAEPGQVLAVVEGPARVLLTGERVCLNLLGRLCGVATATRAMCRLAAGTRARVVDTRKTTPGLRALEKYAVRCGGGGNHRLGLDDAVLIKDNHLVVAGGVSEAVARVRVAVGHMVKVELEVDTLDQLREGLEAGVDAFLLDNMDAATLREAVAIVGGRALLEASGGITTATLASVAATGVDLISVGALTHSAPALDVALDLDPLA